MKHEVEFVVKTFTKICGFLRFFNYRIKLIPNFYWKHRRSRNDLDPLLSHLRSIGNQSYRFRCFFVSLFAFSYFFVSSVSVQIVFFNFFDFVIFPFVFAFFFTKALMPVTILKLLYMWAFFLVGIFPCGHFSLRAFFLVGIFPCGHFSLWAFFLVGIFPCGHFSLWAFFLWAFFVGIFPVGFFPVGFFPGIIFSYVVLKVCVIGHGGSKEE